MTVDPDQMDGTSGDDIGGYGWGDVDPPLPPAAVLQRYNLRVLDPTTAVRRGDQALRPTAYVADELLVEVRNYQPKVTWLTDAAAALNLKAVFPDVPDDSLPHAVATVKLTPLSGATASIDAWAVLQGARARAETDGQPLEGVQLNHLLSCTGAGQPFDGPHGTDGEPAAHTSLYELGRRPITVVRPEPRRHGGAAMLRPTIAVLDTGCGTHPWLGPPAVTRNPPAGTGGKPIGIPDQNQEDRPDEIGPLDGRIDRAKGHGTMICGLIRQVCPDADILSIRLMDSEGYLLEKACIDALREILHLADGFFTQPQSGRRIDVLCLCFGYYLEDVDAECDNEIFRLITALGKHGVLVVASAGNHATVRPMYPAAFTPHAGGRVAKPSADSAPVIGVGALNPNGTIALFSNTGPSVSAWAPGVNVVSTFPLVNAGAGASGTKDPTGPRREDLDIDDFRSGFALWSGTSMAAPIIAARIAQAMLDLPNPQFRSSLDPIAVKRAWDAIKNTEGIDKQLRNSLP